MKKETIASKFNGLIILSICISVLFSSIVITGYLIHRFQNDVHEKDTLHIKGLVGTVKGFVDLAFSLNYQLSINPEIIDSVTKADSNWEKRFETYNAGKEVTNSNSDICGMPLLVKMKKQYEFAELIFVQDAYGDQVARSSGPLGHRGKRWWFKEFTQESYYRPFISKSYYSMTGDRPVASAFHAIYKDNEFIGIIGTDINFKKLQHLVQNYLDSKDLSAIVIDNEGVIIAQPDKSHLSEMYNLKKLTKHVLVKDTAGISVQTTVGYHKTKEVKLDWAPEVSKVVSEALHGKSGFIENVKLDGVNSTLYYDPVQLPGHYGDSNNYAIIMIRDNSSIAKSKLTIYIFVLLFTVSAIIILTFMFHIQLKSVILSPMSTLTESMRLIDKKGHEDVSLNTSDEFIVLADTYNEMRRNLAKAHQELSVFNQELEKRIEVRTNELEGANKQLQNDIAERKEVEKALRESEDRYRKTFEAAPDSISISNINNGKYLQVNNAFCELFGFSGEEAIGKSAEELNLVEDSKEYELLQEMAKSVGEVNSFEMRYRKRDGTILDTLFSARRLKYGEDDCIIAVIRDISSRKKTEEALKESEEKYRLLTENANDAIFIFQDEQVKFPNPTAKRLGRSLSFSIYNADFSKYIHPEDREIVMERYKKRRAGEDVPDICIFRLISPDSEDIWMELNDIRITWAGRPATLNFLHDITEQKKLEIQFQQSQRLDAIGTLAGGIAHNFNNLLMGIQGNISLMLLDDKLSRLYHEEMKNIEQCIDSASTLTKQLLGFARGGKYVVNITNPNEIVKDTVRMFGHSKREIQIHKMFQDNIWTIEVDQGQLELVLLNIYVNAGQAMQKGGDLYLETKNAVINEAEAKIAGITPGKYIKISIEDTGIGMDSKTITKIFEPFFTTKPMGEGTGLGLASAFGIIKNHGGFIEVASRKGEGARFEILLPASQKTITEEKINSNHIAKGNETILLVDDEEIVVDVCQSILKKLGYNVIVAMDGQAGIELYQENKHNIALVILDIIMPVVEGGAVFAKLKEIKPDVKVLLSSGCSADSQASELIERGCKGFIQKPFNMEQLSEKVRAVLDQP